MSVRFIGWDMNAAFALGNALGVNPMAVAVLLPEIEHIAMHKLNEQMDQSAHEA